MNKDVKKYIQNNENYYKNYINGIGYPFLSYSFPVIAITIQMLLVRYLFLTQKFTEEAGHKNLNNIEVRNWVCESVKNNLFDFYFGILLCFAGIMLILIWVLIKKCKNYNLYKKNWPKLLPSGLAILVGVVSVYELGMGNIYLLISICLELFPIVTMINVLFPIETRKVYNYTKIFCLIGEAIIKKR